MKMEIGPVGTTSGSQRDKDPSTSGSVKMVDKRLPVLSERENTHGDYYRRSKICNRIRQALLEEEPDLEDDQLQSIIMIADKLSRIVNGKANVHDHWLDISGYAMLVADRIKNENPTD